MAESLLSDEKRRWHQNGLGMSGYGWLKVWMSDIPFPRLTMGAGHGHVFDPHEHLPSNPNLPPGWSTAGPPPLTRAEAEKMLSEAMVGALNDFVIESVTEEERAFWGPTHVMVPEAKRTGRKNNG